MFLELCWEWERFLRRILTTQYYFYSDCSAHIISLSSFISLNILFETPVVFYIWDTQVHKLKLYMKLLLDYNRNIFNNFMIIKI